MGLFLFLFPVWVDGNMNIPLGLISNAIAQWIHPFSNAILMICVGISAIFHGFALSGDLIGHARIVYGMSFFTFPILIFLFGR